MDKHTQKPILSIDPGLKHFGAVLMMDESDSPYVTIIETWEEDLSGKLNPDHEKMKALLDKILSSLAKDTLILIEYQPPLNVMNNPALIRWNSWIEGYLLGAFRAHGFDTRLIFPISVKHHFKSLTGNYHLNKKVAVSKANDFLRMPITSDHLSDCVLMGIYWFEKGWKK